MLKNLNYIYILTLLILSFIFNYYFGSVGVFPIDTFAFFDSAFSINNGFFPIRDYWTSNGFLVDIMQSVFFKFFFTNWNTYLLHSSLMNFLLVFSSYQFLKEKGLNFKFAFLYSISIGILGYPSAGVPFPDHHSLILSIISFYLLIISFKRESKLYLFFSIFFLFLAFLCKQMPAALFVLLASLYIVNFSYQKKKYYFFYYSFFFASSLLLVFILFLRIYKIPLEDFLIQYVKFPITIGSYRSGNLELLAFLKSLVGEFKFFSLLFIIILFQQFKNKKFNLFNTSVIFILVSLIAIINQELMKNQNIIFFILPILIGIIHSDLNFNDKKIKISSFFFLVLINIFLTAKYHERFNVDRKFMDLQNLDKSRAVDASEISENLQGLKWFTVLNQTTIINEVDLLKEAIEYLKANKKDSMLISYYQFINVEINHPVYSPNRWYTTDGVSYPLKENKYFLHYANFYKQRLIKNKIKKIYTLYPLNEKSFNFVLSNECVKSKKINSLLTEHYLINCF